MIAAKSDWAAQMKQELTEENPEALLADGFDDALIGITANHHHPAVAVYDLDECIRIVMQDGSTEEEAVEYLSFNTLGAYVGEHGPLFIRTSNG